MPDDPGARSATESLTTTLDQMADVVLSDKTLDEIFDLVVALPSDLLPEVAGSSVTLIDNAPVFTAKATGELPRALDDVQYAAGEGPCLSAAKESTITVIDSVVDDTRFPDFTEAALRHDVHSVLSLPLSLGARTSGSLNVYGRTPNAFKAEQQEVGALLADRASVLVANALALNEARTLADQLQEALSTREIIGEAKGILREREGCTSDEAFAMLKTASQNSNTKLRNIAEQLVSGASQEP